LKKRVTIRDVAREAGVSISTVSRVLTGVVPVSGELKSKVDEAVKKLDFKPNEVARGLINRTTRTIGVILPGYTNPFFAEVLRGITASTEGYALLIYCTDYDREHEREYIEQMVTRRVDGFIIVSTHVENRELLKKVCRSTHIVSLQSGLEFVDGIDVDDERASYEMTQYLIGQGHRKIAFLGYKYEVEALKNRYQGFERAMEEHGLFINPEYNIGMGLRFGEAATSARKLIGLSDPPTAVFAINDYYASAVIEAARKMGVRVPEDLSVVGFDDIWPSAMLAPRLTTVRQPACEMGKRAGELILKSIADVDGKAPSRIVLPTRLMIRESVTKI